MMFLSNTQFSFLVFALLQRMLRRFLLIAQEGKEDEEVAGCKCVQWNLSRNFDGDIKRFLTLFPLPSKFGSSFLPVMTIETSCDL